MEISGGDHGGLVDNLVGNSYAQLAFALVVVLLLLYVVTQLNVDYLVNNRGEPDFWVITRQLDSYQRGKRSPNAKPAQAKSSKEHMSAAEQAEDDRLTRQLY